MAPSKNALAAAAENRQWVAGYPEIE